MVHIWQPQFCVCGRVIDMCALQMLFTCVSMVLSLTIFAYILGEISNLVMDQDAELVKTRTQVSVLTTAVQIANLMCAHLLPRTVRGVVSGDCFALVMQCCAAYKQY